MFLAFLICPLNAFLGRVFRTRYSYKSFLKINNIVSECNLIIISIPTSNALSPPWHQLHTISMPLLIRFSATPYENHVAMEKIEVATPSPLPVLSWTVYKWRQKVSWGPHDPSLFDTGTDDYEQSKLNWLPGRCSAISGHHAVSYCAECLMPTWNNILHNPQMVVVNLGLFCVLFVHDCKFRDT